MFCAETKVNAPCYGDSGGPGVINGTLFGVISFGGGCGNQLIPAVYTFVPKYYNWILENVSKEEAEFIKELSLNPKAEKSSR